VAIIDQVITDRYALYNGDSCELLPTLPDESVHLTIYSPPFATEDGGALYHYSSSERDLSNSRTYGEFFTHYEFIVRELYRLTLPGRITAVHCMDVPRDGANQCSYVDFPGDIIRLHEKVGFEMLPRICIWKEPLAVRNRTMSKALAHRQIVEDSTLTNVAAADYLIPFRKRGTNPVPVVHPHGLMSYAGARKMPHDLLKYRGWKGKQTGNRYSHWIWRQYASAVWNDIRGNLGTDDKEGGIRQRGVLPYQDCKEAEDERHMHPLQLDVIERAVVLWSNPGETVLTPFAGVGSEVYGAVINSRKGIGCELKPSYWRQSVANLKDAPDSPVEEENADLFAAVADAQEDDE